MRLLAVALVILIAAILGLLPGFFFYLAILGHHPDVVTQEIPAVYVLE